MSNESEYGVNKKLKFTLEYLFFDSLFFRWILFGIILRYSLGDAIPPR